MVDALCPDVSQLGRGWSPDDFRYQTYSGLVVLTTSLSEFDLKWTLAVP